MRPKIKDVADAAGVSAATVSRVLNKSKHVDPNLEKKVYDAVKSLGYSPNQQARFLSSKKSNVIGIVMPARLDSNLSEFLHVCSLELDQAGFDVIVGLGSDTRQIGAELVNAQLQSHASALLVAGPVYERKIEDILESCGIPVLRVLNTGKESFPGITFNYKEAFHQLLAYAGLTREGRISIIGHTAFLGGQSLIAEYISTFGDRVQVTGISSNTPEAGYDAALSIFEDSVPDAVMALSDFIAIGVLRAAYDKGISVPDQLCVTGFGETLYSHTCTPSLATVRFNYRELGIHAGRAVLRMVNGEVVEGRVCGFELISGGSCIGGQS